MRSRLSTAIFWSLILALLIIFWVPIQKVIAQAGPVVLTATTTSAAQTATQTTVSLTTATGIAQSDGSIAVPSATAGAFIVYIDREAERVIAGSGLIWTVQRGWGGSAQAAHASGRPVWFGLEGRFKVSDPPGIGACTSPVEVTPWINILNGMKWMCRSSAWAATNSMAITYNSDVGQTNITP